MMMMMTLLTRMTWRQMIKKMKVIETIGLKEGIEARKEIWGRIKAMNRGESLTKMEIEKTIEMSIRMIDMQMLMRETKTGRKERTGINGKMCGLVREVDQDPSLMASEGRREQRWKTVINPETWTREIERKKETGVLIGMGKMATERVGPKIDRGIQTETVEKKRETVEKEKETETEWEEAGIEIEMVTEMFVIKKEVREAQRIVMGEGDDPMTEKRRTERQSGMTIASEMIGDRIDLLLCCHYSTFIQLYTK
jgi:hypothetical protein